jgi:hypothetical protein
VTNLLSDSQLILEHQAVAVSVGGIVNTLKQFDASGNLIANPLQTSSPLQIGVNGEPLVVNVLVDPAKTGFLAP